MAGTIALAAVALQLLLTVAVQPFRRAAWLGPFDRAGLLPMWHFFAFGDPGAELRLMVRDGHADAAVTEWREVPIWPARRLRDAVWVPHGIAASRMATLLDLLDRRVAREPGVVPADSYSYAQLLEHVLADPSRGTGATARQFAVVRSRGTRPSETVVTSLFHPLPR